jgi:hypothetical protein
MTSRAVPVLLFALACAACAAPDVPSADDTAAYLAMSAGAQKSYAAGALTEVHELTQSSVLSVDSGIVLDMTARQNGFVTLERTFTWELLVEGARVVRLFDCLVACGALDRPIELFDVPLSSGASKETDVVLTITENGAETAVRNERHTLIVGAEAEVAVPAGTFVGTSVSWTREDLDTGVADTSLLTIVEGTGVVSWDGFDGAALQLQ